MSVRGPADDLAAQFDELRERQVETTGRSMYESDVGSLHRIEIGFEMAGDQPGIMIAAATGTGAMCTTMLCAALQRMKHVSRSSLRPHASGPETARPVV